MIDAAPLDPFAAFDLTGRTAVVTGASSGLGWRFAQVLAAAGAQVVASARRAERLEALAATDTRIVAVAADVADAAGRERLIADAEAALGRIDILVNNAGISDPKPMEQESLDDFTRMIDINLTAVWHLSKLAGAGMVERGYGSIVNIASILGLVGATPLKQAGYTAAKGAVVNMTRELGLQWARKGVRVNALAPGWFTSEMTEEMNTDSGMAFIKQNGPMPRLADPSELDGPLLLLASDAGSFMTGTTVVVDGGWTAR
jgi:NAD(P)-dependent dehydrogenase (short-subunit alcohol dehydrogenase family)